MRFGLIILFSILIVAAVPGAAQEVDGVQFIPVVASIACVGTSQWVSDLTVNNLQGEPVTVGIPFFSENQVNTFDPSFPDRFDLGPRETRVIDAESIYAAPTAGDPCP